VAGLRGSFDSGRSAFKTRKGSVGGGKTALWMGEKQRRNYTHRDRSKGPSWANRGEKEAMADTKLSKGFEMAAINTEDWRRKRISGAFESAMKCEKPQDRNHSPGLK